MNNVGKLCIKMGLLSFLLVMPLAAQIDNGVKFTAPFPFVAGGAKLPAGNYKVFQADMVTPLLQIQSIDDRHSVFVGFTPTQAEQPQRQSTVTFEKYGDTDYLDRVRIGGQDYGVKVDPSQSERKAAADADAPQHSTIASGQ